MYDLIGDIHGHADALSGLLDKLGYEKHRAVFRHREGRRVIFLGDFIDRGPKIRETLEIVRPMIEEGHALAVMGNHEFNAVAFHTPNPAVPGKCLRERTYKNIRQSAETVRQLTDTQLDQYIEWFKTLPFWLDQPELRVVHACWDPQSIAVVENKRAEHEGINDAFFAEACERGSDLYEAVEVLLKGKEIDLPDGVTFNDKDGHVRRSVRVKWYETPEGKSYRDYMMSFKEEERSAVTTTPLASDVAKKAAPYPPDAPPVFVGHYWMPGDMRSAPLAPNVACLDYSVAKEGPLCAYRWNGEDKLNSAAYATFREND